MADVDMAGPPPDPVLEVPPPKEIKILETADDIQQRRTEVLDHYSQFRDFAKNKRDRLEEARQFQYFKRDADELEIWILEKLQTAAVNLISLIPSKSNLFAFSC
jgi:spectrin alpha